MVNLDHILSYSTTIGHSAAYDINGDIQSSLPVLNSVLKHVCVHWYQGLKLFCILELLVHVFTHGDAENPLEM